MKGLLKQSIRTVLIIFITLFLLEIVLQLFSLFTRDRSFLTGTDQKEKRILCLGDSYTYGFGVQAGEDYPSQLGKLLGPDYTVVNRGVPSCNSAILLQKLEQNLATYQPSVTVIQVGMNNAWNYRGYNRFSGSDRNIIRKLLACSRVWKLLAFLHHYYNSAGMSLNDLRKFKEDKFLFRERFTLPVSNPEQFPPVHDTGSKKTTPRGFAC